MKIRTDFVTNSSSSSFCTVQIELTDGTEHYYEYTGDDSPCVFDIASVKSKFKDELAGLTSVNDLINFIVSCANEMQDYLRKEDAFLQFCDELYSVDFTKIKKIKIETDESDMENDCGEHGVLNYDFITGKGSKRVKEVEADEMF